MIQERVFPENQSKSAHKREEEQKEKGMCPREENYRRVSAVCSLGKREKISPYTISLGGGDKERQGGLQQRERWKIGSTARRSQSNLVVREKEI